jgi:hypothetical protein
MHGGYGGGVLAAIAADQYQINMLHNLCILRVSATKLLARAYSYNTVHTVPITLSATLKRYDCLQNVGNHQPRPSRSPWRSRSATLVCLKHDPSRPSQESYVQKYWGRH